MRLDIQVSGPLYDGRADAAAEAFTVDAEQRIADQGVNMVAQVGASSFRNPTGYFVAHLVTERSVGDLVVTDTTVYGPWLEGTSERNRATRFKGYALYRRTAQALDRLAVSIAERVLPDYLRRMQ